MVLSQAAVNVLSAKAEIKVAPANNLPCAGLKTYRALTRQVRPSQFNNTIDEEITIICLRGGEASYHYDVKLFGKSGRASLASSCAICEQ